MCGITDVAIVGTVATEVGVAVHHLQSKIENSLNWI